MQKTSLNSTCTPKRLCLHLLESVEYWELLAEGCIVTADVCIEQQRNLKANLENARSKQHEVYFRHDNVHPHIARKTKAELMKFGWTILPHPPYFPDLAPSGYHLYLFSYLQSNLDGQYFQSRGDIKRALEHFSSSQRSRLEVYTMAEDHRSQLGIRQRFTVIV
ncbi:hypothetical protein RB195_019695 [Necator americanus]|uniref:Tc1-like transposase DDE domain-containing protein n=1 Tax=Necator americanus TaxID=51031 RepID=A0ABR1CFD1_NECAM